MLDFRLDPDQEMLVQAIRRFANGPIRAAARDAEEDGKVPDELVRSGWEIGLLQAALPERFSGLGEYSVLTQAIALEEFACGDLAVALQIFTPHLFFLPILFDGSRDQQAAHLPAAAGGSPPAVSAALIEPVVQFDPRRQQTQARREGDGYVLSGTKIYVPLADQADKILLWASDSGHPQAFLVDARSTGLRIGPRDRLMGIQAVPTFRLELEQVRVPAEARLGEQAGCDFDRFLNHSRAALGAAAVGLARSAYEYARDYARQRVQFGRPIAQNQSIAFLLADMASDVESMRLLVWEVAWLLDQGRDASREAVIMKHFIDQAVLRVADGAVQILGGYGYIREYPVELALRNARGFSTFDGLAII